jgi:hypothetical protein
MNKIFGIAITALVLASCQNSGGSKKVTPVSEPATLTAPALPAAGANQPASSDPAAAATQPVSAPAATGNGAAVALNPAHGAPGHRCDIQVGAPLNSAPGNAAAPATSPIQLQSPPPMLPPPTLTQPVNSNARLNPAHGQPGHDCSVPVGQPLKS